MWNLFCLVIEFQKYQFFFVLLNLLDKTGHFFSNMKKITHRREYKKSI